MFCPKCGMDNQSNQRFCCRCGLALESVQLAACGAVDRSLDKLKIDNKIVRTGVAILSVFTLIGFVIAFLGTALTDAGLMYIAAINFLLGLLLGLPLTFFGNLKLGQSLKILSSPVKESDLKMLNPAKQTAPHYLKPNKTSPSIYNTVTESTTANLHYPAPRISGELN